MNHRERNYLDCVRQFGPNYAGFDFPTTELVLNILFTYDVLHQCTAKYLADFGLSRSTFNVLMLLQQGPPEGMQLHDLGEMLLVSRANVTGLISHLEEKGLVTREVSELDRRARYAKVTEKALQLLERLLPIHYRATRHLLGDLSDSNKGRLVQLLGEVRASIHQHAHVCGQVAEAKL